MYEIKFATRKTQLNRFVTKKFIPSPPLHYRARNIEKENKKGMKVDGHSKDFSATGAARG